MWTVVDGGGRDASIQQWETTLAGRMKAPKDQDIVNSLSPEQRDLLRKFTPAIVDTALHHFLWMLDERADLTLSVHVDSGTVSSLREAVIDAGTIPHHIVSRFADDADDARTILANHKIDLDSHWNGVFLPSRNAGSAARGAIHENLHTTRYYEILTERLKKADRLRGRGSVLRELQRIRSDLLDGTFESLLPRNINY
jgi:hypothetical protein